MSPAFFEMASNDPKQGGGFFASIASSLQNLGNAMHKSVNGYLFSPPFSFLDGYRSCYCSFDI